MQRRRRLNPTEDQERRAAAVLRAHYKREYTPATLPTASADYDMAVDLANRILAGEEVAEALAGTGLVVDMSPQPAQIAEIETSQGVIEVPVKESAPPTVVNWFRVQTSATGAGFKQLYRQRGGSRTAMGFDTLAEAVKEAEHTLAIGDGDGYDVQTVRILRVDVDPETEEEIPNTGTVVWESSSRTSVPAPVVEYFPGSRRPSPAAPEDDLPSFDDAVQAIDRANATARTADPDKLRGEVHQLLKRLPKSTLKQVAQHFDVVFQPIAGYSPVDQLIAETFGSKLVTRALRTEDRNQRKAYSRMYSR